MQKATDHRSTLSGPVIFSACLVAGIGALAFNTLPLINGLWMKEYGYGVKEIGAMNGAQLAGFTIGIFSSLLWVAKLPPPPVIVAGLLGLSGIAMLPQLSSPIDWLPLFSLLGFANALVMAPVVALLGKAGHPERAYGFMYVFQMLLAIGITLMVTGGAVSTWELRGALTLLGAVSILGIAPALMLSAAGAREIRQTCKAAPPNWPAIMFISLGLLLFMSGMVGIWSFLDALESLQLETTKPVVMDGQSFLVSLSLVAALAGSFAAAWLDDKAGVFLPLSLGLVLILIGIISMALAARVDVFWTGALIASFGWNFALVYATAELAHADRSGGIVALSPGIIGLGGALGTVGLGAILASGGAVIFYAAAGIIIALGFLFLFFGANVKTRPRISWPT